MAGVEQVKPEAVRISEIMKQINKVSGQIEKIQPRGNVHAKQLQEVLAGDTSEEEFDFNNPKTDVAQDLVQEAEGNPALSESSRKKRNAWANKKETKQTEDDQGGQKEEGDDTIRPLKVKENKLPRWA